MSFIDKSSLRYLSNHIKEKYVRHIYIYIDDTKIIKMIIKKLIKYKKDKLINPYNTNMSIKKSNINGKSILNRNKAKKIELHILIPKKDINNKNIRRP